MFIRFSTTAMFLYHLTLIMSRSARPTVVVAVRDHEGLQHGSEVFPGGQAGEELLCLLTPSLLSSLRVRYWIVVKGLMGVRPRGPESERKALEMPWSWSACSTSSRLLMYMRQAAMSQPCVSLRNRSKIFSFLRFSRSFFLTAPVLSVKYQSVTSSSTMTESGMRSSTPRSAGVFSQTAE